MKHTNKGFRPVSLLWFLITAGGLILDRWTKNYVDANMETGESLEIVKDFFYITRHKNTGAAWGILDNLTLVLGILSVVVSIFLVYLFIKYRQWPVRLPLSMIIGGALGNAVGRIFFGGVTDFLNFYIFGYDFPIFNVADMLVTVGTAILIVYILFFHKEDEKTAEVVDGDEKK
jgi:signal peptidase II